MVQVDFFHGFDDVVDVRELGCWACHFAFKLEGRMDGGEEERKKERKKGHACAVIYIDIDKGTLEG